MKRKLVKSLFLSLTLFLFLKFIFLPGRQLSASHLNIEGWDIIESKGKVILLQKKDQDFVSEAMLNLSVAIGGDILKGYSIKKGDNLLVTDYFTNTVPLGLWRLIYKGFDSSGNIHLKIIRERDDLSLDDKARIRKEIERVSGLQKDKNVLEERLVMFEGFKDFLDKEGEDIIIDPAKIIIISNINNFPPIKIEVNNQHSVIHIAVAKLD
ncbi:MAG: hypothetical protein GX336_05965 [Halanaerobiaceae bacterium]|nr:hypothetical protein [Halanaerobiaceae bacterium]